MIISSFANSYNTLLISKLISPRLARHSAKKYHILRPWSSGRSASDHSPTSVGAGPSCSSVCEARSLIEEPLNKPLSLKNVVLFNKRTRYEFEKMIANRQSEKDFENYVRLLGSDYNKLLEHHNQHHNEMKALVSLMKKRGINVEVVNRSDFDHEKLNSVDAVITAGGDGTFLQAAGWVKNNTLPVIGFNTDPKRSQGHLCLPDLDIDDIFDRLQSGRYRWLNRQRIEVSVSSCETVHVTDLHVYGRPSFQYPVSTLPPDPELPGFVTLPSLALNEVFIGENNNAIAAYYEMCLDREPPFKQKSSGLTVSTGTGSTSWYHTIASLHPDTVKSLLELANNIAKEFSGTSSNAGLPTNDPKFVSKVVQTYNNKLLFHPEERRMAYAARDPIVNEIYKLTAPRGFCSTLRIRSRMQEGGLVIDGGVKYAFSIGTEAVIRIAPQSQALRTVSFFHPRRGNQKHAKPVKDPRE